MLTYEGKTMQTINFFKTKKDAIDYVGGKLRSNKKMPCKTFNTSAWDCQTGGKLSGIPGTVCYECYARDGHYLMYRDEHSKGYTERKKNMDQLYWVDAMIKQIGNDPYFRWFGSGDLQSLENLEKIVTIAERLPNTLFWLPTHEPKYIKAWLDKHRREYPKNLIIRISAVYVDKPCKLPKALQGHENILTSTVHTVKPIKNECQAHHQEGACQDCRNCWDTRFDNISYKAH